jgi:hypothetical protein
MFNSVFSKLYKYEFITLCGLSVNREAFHRKREPFFLEMSPCVYHIWDSLRMTQRTRNGLSLKCKTDCKVQNSF